MPKKTSRKAKNASKFQIIASLTLTIIAAIAVAGYLEYQSQFDRIIEEDPPAEVIQEAADATN